MAASQTNDVGRVQFIISRGDLSRFFEPADGWFDNVSSMIGLAFEIGVRGFGRSLRNDVAAP
jgi:hypothetical protein